ncbi:hypothetical protein ANAPC1_00462 [Anaplasma phagocytophilum]|uniref:Uncharacterized protein n=1 Tax=Anaplasma phagocytophilum TaxID=948 RepID=A0AA45UT32_ANAPH|nr:hypothetical protein ANAPC1_00462 [Anaplasma phagocytophilum]SBO32621.1 hypothetical protein ANAPC2_01095 [Anaplasma phagocytophilum]SBO33211.1 hypothetical protein ANAPC3_01142 [Anaplasma phagocytophilum]SBO33235.1 hypothetical protein ANAPC4_01084 [Anaplasma phagocytophilum]SCV65100.1 hypothetical protein ANAPRD1_00768 [Anaplasma phagocytophilum]
MKRVESRMYVRDFIGFVYYEVITEISVMHNPANAPV